MPHIFENPKSESPRVVDLPAVRCSECYEQNITKSENVTVDGRDFAGSLVGVAGSCGKLHAFVTL